MKLHLGCGWRNFGESWVHIDAGDYGHLDHDSIVDLSRYEEESVDLIYASHVLEYFDREQVVEVLREWSRVLKTGATLRVAVPDFETLSKLYCNTEIGLDNILGPVYGKMKMSNETIYHKTAYDFESLQKLLRSCGFQNIKRYDWRKTEHSNFDDHSQAYIPHMQKNTGTLVSLNVECVK